MSEIVLSDGVIRVVIAPLQAADVQRAGELLAAASDQPARMARSQRAVHWWSRAIDCRSRGLALSLRVNDGAICGVLLALRDDQGRAILEAAESMWDVDTTLPAMLQAARDWAAAQGSTLVRVRVATVYDPA